MLNNQDQRVVRSRPPVRNSPMKKEATMRRLGLAFLTVLKLTIFISVLEPGKAHPPVISAVEFGHPVRADA